MRIAYAINGEGMGHAVRSSAVISYLLDQGHEIRIISFGERPVQFLEKRFGPIIKVHGFHMTYQDNSVRRIATLLRGIRMLPTIFGDTKCIRAKLAGWKPDCVITDFDFHGFLIAREYGVPLVSIDNVQLITAARVPVHLTKTIDYALNYLIAKIMVPRADRMLITTLASSQYAIQQPHAVCIPPILREPVRTIQSTKGESIVVYQTSQSYTELFTILDAFPEEHFIVYNTATPKRVPPHITRKDFDEQGLLADIAAAKAVIVNGGFNVISESLYFKKPVLSIPISHHYEQWLNGYTIESLGVGQHTERLTVDTLRDFIKQLPKLQTELDRRSTDQAAWQREVLESLEKVTTR